MSEEKIAADNTNIVLLMSQICPEKTCQVLEILHSNNNVAIDWCKIFENIANSTVEEKNQYNIITFLLNLNSDWIATREKKEQRLIDILTTEEKQALKKHIFDSPIVVDQIAKKLIEMIHNMLPDARICETFYQNFCYLLQLYPEEIIGILRLATDKIIWHRRRVNNEQDDDNSWDSQDYSFSNFIFHIIWNLAFVGIPSSDSKFKLFETMVNKNLKHFLLILTFDN